MRSLYSFALTLLALALFGCDTPPTALPPYVGAPLEVGVTAQNGTTRIDGEIGGAAYALFRPADWNGSLVLYAHGFIDAGQPLALPTNDNIVPLRDALLEQGYAVAYSSFSENGFAVRDGAQRTHQLRGIFTSRFGAVQRTYLMGHSMGGLIALMLAERHPQQYDGALAMCGLLGGSQAQIDYIAHTRVLFDALYPNVIPGSVLDIPTGLGPAQVQAAAVGAILQAPPASVQGAGALAAVMGALGTPVPAANPNELIQSIVTALVFHNRGFDDLIRRTHGHSPFGNVATHYPLVPGLNQTVGRFSSTPDAANYLRHWYEPTGQLRTPVLTLNTSRDPVAPHFHQTLLQQRADGTGSSGNLHQLTIDRYGHCNFQVPEMRSALLDLDRWARTGTKP